MKGKPNNQSSTKPNSKTKFKGKKGYNQRFKPKENGESNRERTDYETKTNHPDWYVSDEQMKKDIARFNFSYAAGERYPFLNFSSTGLDGTAMSGKCDVVAPGAQIMYLRPALPMTTGLNDPVNQAGMKIATYLRHTLSAKIGVEGPDIMAMLIAMGQVYSYFNFATRLYALPSLISNLNRYTPQSLIAAQGVDPYSLLNNIAQFRESLNMQIRRAASLSVPSSIKYFARTAFLYSNIYTGGTAIQDQLYMYAPAGFWRYSEADGPAHLEYVQWMSENSMGNRDAVLYSWSDVIHYGNRLLEPLFNSDDVVTISSLILRAYGTQNTLKLALLQDNAIITPIFDIAVLEQMANADVPAIQLVSRFKDWDVKQTTNLQQAVSGLEFKPRISAATPSGWNMFDDLLMKTLAGRKVLNTKTAYTTEDLVLESSRLMFSIIPSKGYVMPDGINASINISGGTEIVTKCIFLTSVMNAGVLYTDSPSLGYYATAIPFEGAHVWMDIVADPILGNSEKIGKIQLRSMSTALKFKFSPKSVAIAYDGAHSITDATMLWDLDNYTIIDKEELEAMNKAITYALFDVSVVTSAYKG